MWILAYISPEFLRKSDNFLMLPERLSDQSVASEHCQRLPKIFWWIFKKGLPNVALVVWSTTSWHYLLACYWYLGLTINWFILGTTWIQFYTFMATEQVVQNWESWVWNSHLCMWSTFSIQRLVKKKHNECVLAGIKSLEKHKCLTHRNACLIQCLKLGQQFLIIKILYNWISG